MTENEVIEWLRKMQNPMISEAELYCAETCYGLGKMVYPEPEDYVFETAIQALEEIQQYRTIGTVECYENAINAYTETYILMKEYKSKLQDFESIGTIEEFKVLKEKYKNVKEDVGELLCSEYDDSSCPFSIHNEIVNGICSSVSGNVRRRI